MNGKRIIIGIGNSGRTDDGLGWAFLDAMETMRLEDTDLEYKYQLQVEDADLILQYDEVLFVDASNNRHPKGFKLYPIVPEIGFAYSTHALEPAVVVGLCKQIYGRIPECNMLEITGAKWGLGIGMSDEALGNLKAAINSVNIHSPELV